MRFEVPAGSSLVFSDAEGQVLNQPLIQRLNRVVQVPAPEV